jgi:hypothetical protein
MRGGFLPTGQEIGRRRWTFVLSSFVEALGMRMSDRGPSTDATLPLTLLVLGDSL